MKIKQVDINHYLKSLSVDEKNYKTIKRILNKFKGIEFEFSEIDKRFKFLNSKNKESTKNTYKKYVNAFIKYLNKKYNLDIGKLKIILISTSKKNVITYDEYIMIVNAASYKYKDVIQAHYILGVRVESLKKITWEDIQNNEKLDTVSKGREKTIFFPERLTDLAKGKTGPILKKHESSYNRHLKKVSNEVLGFGITSHALRKLRANHLRMQGIDISVIKDILGHESIETTDGYFHTFDEEIKKAMELL